MAVKRDDLLRGLQQIVDRAEAVILAGPSNDVSELAVAVRDLAQTFQVAVSEGILCKPENAKP